MTGSLSAPFRVEHVGDVDSSNDLLRERASVGEEAGLVIVARSQNKGRGRHGRNWSSPPGNLYCSILLRPLVPVTHAATLSLVTGLAAADTLAKIDRNLDVCLKWPNDVLLGEAKLAGILLESGAKPSSAMVDWLIIGMGINLVHKPDNLPHPAATLAEHGHQVSPSEFLDRFLPIAASHLQKWQQFGFAELRDDWMGYAFGVGSDITVRGGGEPISGQFLGVDENGTLQLKDQAGHDRRLNTGDIMFSA